VHDDNILDYEKCKKIYWLDCFYATSLDEFVIDKGL
jgi:hypothetical protein